jgi:CelD/BcsL family acetyltransferase involved in cellulose biosynthesis
MSCRVWRKETDARETKDIATQNDWSQTVRVEVIETMPSLQRLEQDWNAIYDADPDAQLFLSFTWLTAWLGWLSGPWFILAAKASEAADAPYVALLPLRMLVKSSDTSFYNEVNMAGNFSADYTGILCRPGFEHLAIPAFARQLKQMNWARLNLENIRMSEVRYRLLMAHFPKANFEISQISRVGKADGIDNALCPYATLPPDWNAYLDSLSANTRQKIRRLLKQFEASDEYRITVATPETIERDLDTLLRFWEIKWTPRKGDLVPALIRSNRAMLLRSFKSDLLYLPTLWHGDRPLAALATLIDRSKRSFLFYMTGRDETFDGPPPGVILHAHSIRYAIENGFTEYDFLRGNEPYKYSFGVKERSIRYTMIGTKNGRNLGGRLDPRTVPAALKEATDLHQARKLPQAERGYRQILEVDPENPDAIHRLGQLLTTTGNHTAAQKQFKMLTKIKPEAFKAWLCLAQSCEALAHHLDAARAYREVIKLQPEAADGFNGLGRMLHKLGRIEEFDAAMDLVLAGDRRAPERNGRAPDRRTVGAAPASTLSH